MNEQKKLMFILLAFVSVLLLITASNAFGVRTTWESVYDYGEQALLEGRYADAAAIFSTIEQFGDSDEQLAMAQQARASTNEQYNDALRLINVGDYLEAYEILVELDDEACIRLAKYCERMLLLEQGDAA